MAPTDAEHHRAEESRERGRAARSEVTRSRHAEYAPAPDRPDPVALLEEQAEGRVPELVPIRYGRMLVSPFSFYRGAALIMAGDLAATPVSGLRAQLCGDAHLSNFGVFGSPERRLVFDVNDFDETLLGPWEWDVKRLAASLAVAGRENGFTPRDRAAVVRACARRYREAMREFASQSHLEVFYASLDVDKTAAQIQAGLRTVSLKRSDKDAVRRTERQLAKARTRDSTQALAKLTHEVGGEPRIRSDPPLIVPVRDLLPEDRADELTEWVHARLREYRGTLAEDRRRLLERYRFVEVARKVVGVGSVGTQAWIMLLLGRRGRDPLFLQIKEAQPSVLERFVGRSGYRNHGHRVVAGQRLMQAASDIFLGWLRVPDLAAGVKRDFYVRQLRDWKGSAEVERMLPRGMRLYAKLCGWTLARAHARSGDGIAIAAYLGKADTFDRAIAAFAEIYADQNELDYAALQEAVAGGRIVAQTGI